MATENTKLKQAIEILRNAQNEKHVKDAIALKDELIWFNLDDELKDEWYEAFGDVKHYHPEED